MVNILTEIAVSYPMFSSLAYLSIISCYLMWVRLPASSCALVLAGWDKDPYHNTFHLYCSSPGVDTSYCPEEVLFDSIMVCRALYSNIEMG